jgi:putative addiction module killer protein
MLPFVPGAEVREYLDAQEHSPFHLWFEGLPGDAAAKVTTAITRLSLGNFSNVEGVGAGVSEYRIDFGPGYRVYFGKGGSQLIILLGGGKKKRQQRDIDAAKARWAEYKHRKARENP